MIPILFESTATDFSTNGIGRLSEARLCKVTEERNGLYELTIDYPISAPLFSKIQNESLIVAVPFRGGKRQAFSVYEISDPINGLSTISAQHISYRANDIPIKPFSSKGITETLSELNSAQNAFEPNPFTITSDIENADSPYSLTLPRSLRSCLGGMDGSLLDVFASKGTGEFEWDNFNIKFWFHRGSDKGYTVRYAKNLKDLNRVKNSSDVATGILPYWSNTEENIYIWGSVQYAENADEYPIKKTRVLDCGEHFTDEPSIADLNAYALAYVNGLDQIKETMDIQFYDVNGQDVNLCDTVHVYYPKLGIKYEKKVIKTIWDVLTDRYESITIGDAQSDLAGTLTKAINEVKTYANNKFINVTQYVDKENGRIYDRIDEVVESIGDSLTGITVLYLQNEGETPAQNDPNWSVAYPEKEEGMRIWTEERYSYTDGHFEYSTPRDISDEGIVDIKVQYYKSTSGLTQTGGDWRDTIPTMESGYYLWTRNEYTTVDGDKTHSEPTLALHQLYSEIVKQNTAIDQTSSYISLHAEEIDNITKMNGVNYSPYFSRELDDVYDEEEAPEGYWKTLNDQNGAVIKLIDGWARITSSANSSVNFYPVVNSDLESDTATLLIEIRNSTFGASSSLKISAQNDSALKPQYYSSSIVTASDDGVYRLDLSKSTLEDPTILTKTVFAITGTLALDIRISIYRDSYPGSYVPYIGLTDELASVRTFINNTSYADRKYASDSITDVVGRVGTIENQYVSKDEAKSISQTETKTWYETELKQDYDAYKVTISETKEVTDTLNGIITDKYEKYFKFDQNGLTVGESSSDVRGRFDNDSLDFIDQNDKRLAWVAAGEGLGGDRLSIGDASTNNKRWNIFTSTNGQYLRFTRHS